MPTSAKNINAFDLKLLKSLINLKINRNYTIDLSAEQKRDLCKSYNTDGVLKRSANYIVKIWPSEGEIIHKITIQTLNDLTHVLKPEYHWHLFVHDISILRPQNIPINKPYADLSGHQKNLVDKTIEEIFNTHKCFEDFEKEIIDKNSSKNQNNKNTSHPSDEVQTNKTEVEIKLFANKIYIELITRKAAILIDEQHDVIEEIYNSWYKLFCIIRDELKTLPISYLKDNNTTALAMQILNEVLRPHLTEHQAKYRDWLEKAKRHSKNKNIAPQVLQKKYPDYNVLIHSLEKINQTLIDAAEKFYDFSK